MDVNTQIMAKHYRDVRKILRNVKVHLKQDADYIHRNLDDASEESDFTLSRGSSCRTLDNHPIPCSAMSSEDLHEPVMRESFLSTSTADETDGEYLNTVEVLMYRMKQIFGGRKFW